MGRHASDCPRGLDEEVALRILATSDLHMNLLSYDYLADRPVVTVGLERTAALIEASRRDWPNTLLFDNGDSLCGTPLADTWAGWRKGQDDAVPARHPMILAMTELGYDAITLGNHDFDEGYRFLTQSLMGAPFPVVSTNVTTRDMRAGAHNMPPWRDSALLRLKLHGVSEEAQDLTVGVLGVLPPRSVTGVRREGCVVEIGEIVETLRAAVPAVRAQGADLVIVLAHSGFGDDDAHEGMENAVIPIAAIDGVDAIISGHDHRTFPGEMPGCDSAVVDHEAGLVHGVPVVSPGFWGSHLGVVDLRLRRTGARWQVVDRQVEARPIARRDTGSGATVSVTAPLSGFVAPYLALHRQTRSKLKRPLATTRRAIHSYFALAGPSPAVEIVQHAKLWYVQNALADRLPKDVPLLALGAPFKTGGIGGPTNFTRVARGTMTERALADIYPYHNHLCALRMRGDEILAWLEEGAKVFCRIEPGSQDGSLQCADRPGYLFSTVLGLEMEIDLAAPAGAGSGRVTLRRGGAPLDLTQEFIMLTNTFRLTAGLFQSVAPERILLDDGVAVREVLAAYARHHGVLDMKMTPSWRFAPMPGTSVSLMSAPEAAAHIDDLPWLDLTPGQVGADGLRAYHLAL